MISIRNLSCRFGDVPAVDDVSLEIGSGEIVAVVGTSGSGKTTLMRMINRMTEPTSGQVLIDGRDNRAIPAYELRRGIGYVIQGHGLFPHRTVAENIAAVPQLLGWSRARIAARVEELLVLFGLDPAEFRDRRPQALSGGQQQRVGVARALAAEPPVLLMDEPFGALDPIIRDKAQHDLLDIQRHFGTTIVLVTHDMDEAMRLGSRIAVMDRGRLQQYSRPQEIISTPANDFVLELLQTGDRAFRMLALQKVRDLVEPGFLAGVPVDADISLRAALAECLWSGRDVLPVVSASGPVGIIRQSAIEHAAQGARAAPGNSAP